MRTYMFVFIILTLLLVVEVLVRLEPVEFNPCEKYGKPKASVILVEKNRIVYECGEIK